MCAIRLGIASRRAYRSCGMCVNNWTSTTRSNGASPAASSLAIPLHERVVDHVAMTLPRRNISVCADRAVSTRPPHHRVAEQSSIAEAPGRPGSRPARARQHQWAASAGREGVGSGSSGCIASSACSTCCRICHGYAAQDRLLRVFDHACRHRAATSERARDCLRACHAALDRRATARRALCFFLFGLVERDAEVGPRVTASSLRSAVGSSERRLPDRGEQRVLRLLRGRPG